MSRLWKKRAWGIKLNVEDLEARAVPANISAVVIGGVLTIRAENDDSHAFNISGTGDRSVAIRSNPGTTINGRSDVVFIGDIKRGIDIQTGNGADSIVISGVHGRDFLSIVTNGGDDAVHVVHDTRSLQSTNIRTGAGNDVIIVNNSTFRKQFAIEAGDGDDLVDMGLRNRFGQNTTANGGAGNNRLGEAKNDFRRAATIMNFGERQNAVIPITVNDTATIAAKTSTTVNVLANDITVQGTITLSSVKVNTQPTGGTATVNADGTIAYTNTSGTSDSFRYTITNSTGGLSAPGLVTISIAGTPVTPDTTAPVGTLASTSGVSTNAASVPVTLGFGESVTGLEAADFTLTNATLTSLSGTGAAYTFTLTPIAEGAFSAQLKAQSVVDAAGNKNDASNLLSRTSDKTAPTIVASPRTTNDTTPLLSGTVNDSTSTISVTVGGETVAGTINGGNWTAQLATALAEGKFTITAKATDAAGNVGTSTLADGLVIDTTAPTVTITSAQTSPTTTTPINFTATFSENVSDFALADLTVTGGTPGSFTATNERIYTFIVTPTAAGTVGVSVAAAKATDAAGNANTASNSFTIAFDSGTPAITLTSSTTSPTKTTPIPVTATFTRDVVGFELGDILVTGGTPGTFVAVDKRTYTFSVTPTGQGTVTVNVNAAAAQDAGNGKDSTAATALTRVFDAIAPGATINSTTTNSKFPTITGTTSEPGATVVVTANGKSANATVTGKDYTATFTNEFPEGVFNISVVVSDAAGNANPFTNAGGLVVDLTASTVQIISPLSSPTNAVTIPIEVGFAEVISGFTQDDLVVTNGTISNFMAIGDDQSFTFDITPTGDGAVTVNIAAGKVQDPAGNANVAGTFTITSERFAPTATITTSATDPTNDLTLGFTVTFSEPVTEFLATDVGVSNGAVSGFTPAADGKTFNFSITPTADGAVIVSVAAGVAKDSGNNLNTAATSVTIVSDRTAPTTTLSTTTISPTSDSPLLFTVVFSEDVNGFVLGDIGVTNGTVTKFTTVNDGNYTFEVTPTANGDVVVSVPAGKATDDAENANIAATAITIAFTSAGPTTTIATTATSPTNSMAIPFTVTFGSDVIDFIDSDVTITNGTIANFTIVSGSQYKFNVTPMIDGDVIVAVAADKATAGGVGNKAATNVTILSDRTAPTTTLNTTALSPTSETKLSFTVLFSEDVNDFVMGDLSVINGDVSNFQTVTDGKYTFDVTPIADGEVRVGVAAATAKDDAGNDNTAATSITIVFNAQATTTIATSAANPTNLLTIPYTVTFSETVTEFVEGDVVVTGGALTNFMIVSGTQYKFDVTPSADGDVVVSVAANVALDSGSLGNKAATPVTIVSDRTVPTVAISTTAANPSNLALLPFTVLFSEGVENFVQGDVVITGGTIANFTADSGSKYTFNVMPTANGPITVSVAAAVANDLAGNDNTVAADVTITSDRNAPVGTFTTASTSPTNAASIAYTLEFDEGVSVLLPGELVIVNGTIDNFQEVSPSKYTFNVLPIADGDVSVSLPADAAQDNASNGNAAASSGVTVSDRTAPTTTITTAETSPTSTSPILFTVTFGESVLGFEEIDIGVSNGTIAGFMMTSPTTYTFNVTPIVDGNVSVSVIGGVAADAAGNSNLTAADATIVSDRTDPVGTINAASVGAITGTAFDVGSSVASVQISISNGTNFWDGTGFNSPTPILFDVTTGNDFLTWSFTFAAGSYTVAAVIIDDAGLRRDLTLAVIVT